jgi:hypothetical protein
MEAFQPYLPKAPSANLIHDIVVTVTAAATDAVEMEAGAQPRKNASAKDSKKDQNKNPKKDLKKEVELDFPRAGHKRSVWFLEFQGSEFGPLSLAEVQVILRSGKLKGQLFARREGVLNWMSVEEIPEFSDDVAATGKGKNKPESAQDSQDAQDERRVSRRVPLVATVKFNVPGDSTAGSNMYMGVCRDISTHGVLILSNRVPHGTTEAMQLEVSPLGSTGVEPFVAEVEVVRVLSDKKGFSVRFKKLDAVARAALQKYLSRHS